MDNLNEPTEERQLNKEFFRQLGENDESVLNEYMNQIQQGRLSIKTIANLDLNSKLHLDALANHGFDPVFAISMITEAKQLLNGKDIFGIVKLNVGGQLFETTEATLSDSNYFMTLLNGQIKSKKDQNGYYFLDKCPKKFEIILQYLRDKTLNLRRLSHIEKASFMQDADFYQLTSITTSNPNLKLSDEISWDNNIYNEKTSSESTSSSLKSLSPESRVLELASKFKSLDLEVKTLKEEIRNDKRKTK